MFRTLAVFVILVPALSAETLPMTLRQAVETALKQNPDLVLARLEVERAQQAVRVARDPFAPRVVVGSGLAYSNGFPLSIEGAAPSIVQANATQFLFNRQQQYAVAQARENARGALLGAEAKREEVAYRSAVLYLDVERAARISELAAGDARSLEQVLRAVEAQVREGRALPLAEKQAALSLARARQSAESLEADRVSAENTLAVALGFGAQDRVQAIMAERAAPELPGTEEDAIHAALASNKEIRQLESQIAAKGLEMRGERAARLPRADLVAEYAILARFNNYDEFFRRFQRNNGQVGVSLQLPLLPGPGIGAQIAQTRSDSDRLRTELTAARNRIISEIQQTFRDVKKAETAAGVARLDLEVAQEQLAVILAQVEEGRATRKQAEEAQVAETDKRVAFQDSQYALEKSRWSLLHASGGLIAWLEKTASPSPRQRP
jgi:outer membrane protein TolC